MKKYIVPLIMRRSLLPVYLYSVGGHENQYPIHRPNGYTEFIWLHTVKGRGKLILDGTEYIMEPKTGILIYSGVPHQYYALEEPWETHWVAFHGVGVRPLLQMMGLPQSELFTLSNVQLLERHLNEIFTTANIKGPDIGLKTSGKLYSLLIDLTNCIVNERIRTHASANDLLQHALTYIEDHYDSEISMVDMAGALGISHQYLCRIFNLTLQMAPNVYLTRLRLQKAKELLLEQDISIAETGRKIGFRDCSYFCSIFKRYEGMTPLEFKRSNR